MLCKHFYLLIFQNNYKNIGKLVELVFEIQKI